MANYLSLPGARRETAPFFFSRPERTPIALLLIHGLAASPWEVLEIGKKAFQTGFSAYGVRLAGHGTSVEDLEKQSWKEWVRSVREGYDLLTRFSDRVVLVGESLGGLLSLYAASEQLGEGVITLAAPLCLKWLPRMIIRSVPPPIRFLDRKLAPGTEPYYYPRHSVHALREMLDLSRVVEQRLTQVRQPLFVLQSERDSRVDPESGRRIYEKAGAGVRELITFSRDKGIPHVMTTRENPVLDEVLERLFSFLKRNFA